MEQNSKGIWLVCIALRIIANGITDYQRAKQEGQRGGGPNARNKMSEEAKYPKDDQIGQTPFTKRVMDNLRSHENLMCFTAKVGSKTIAISIWNDLVDACAEIDRLKAELKKMKHY